MKNKIQTPRELYERLHKELIEEHHRQDLLGEKRYEMRGTTTPTRDGICFGIEKAIRILEKAKEDIADE